MNKWSFAASILVVLGVTSIACKKNDESASADGGGDGGSATAVNASDVTRYPQENPLASVAATVIRDSGTMAHRSPPDGALVATLAKGASVVEIAQANHAFLATFDDPADGKRKMGWINEDAFNNDMPPEAGAPGWPHAQHHDAGAPVAVPGAPVNTTGQIVVPATGNSCPPNFVKSAHDGFCHKSCTSNPDCPAGTCKKNICTVG